MRIFISYGHRDAADHATRLGRWLRTQGHDPWVDTEKGLRPDTGFDVRIENAIKDSAVVVALLSPWSLRPESFCRNEILFAQAMRVPIVPLRVADVIPPIQIISLSYVDASDGLESAFEKLPRIIEEVVRTGTMPRRDWRWTEPAAPWWAAHRPLDFHEDLARHGGTFVGRDGLFEEIGEWMKQPGSRVMLLTADAGVGKSAIAAQMTARLNVPAVHFCSGSNIESCRPQAWLAELMYQLAAQFPDYRTAIERFDAPNWGDPPESLFRTLVADPLRACQSQLQVKQPWLMVIDGLDESLAAAGPGLVKLLAEAAQRLPDCLRVLITSRPDQVIVAALRMPEVRHRHLGADSEQNQADVKAYVAQRLLSDAGITVGVEGLSRVTQLAAGNFLFARMVLDAVTSRDPEARVPLDDISALPASLGGLYHAMFAKRFADRDSYEGAVAPLVDCLVAAREPLPEPLLLTASGPDEHLARQGLRALSQFLSRTEGKIRFFHQSLVDWLCDPELSVEFAASLASGHRCLAEACWSDYRAGPATMSLYTAAHLATHLREAGQWDDLLQLVTSGDLNLVGRWVRHGEGDDGLSCLSGLIGHLERGQRQAVTSAGLATQLARIFSYRGQYEEAERWLRHAVARTSLRHGRRIRAVALHELGSLELYRARRTEAARYYRRALRLCRWGRPVYHDEVAANLVGLATVAYSKYRFAKTVRLAARAIAHAARAGDSAHVIAGERLIASACKALGRYPEAESHIETALDLARVSQERLERAALLLLHGFLLYDLATLGEETPVRAQRLFQQALADAERVHDLYAILEAKLGLGRCALAAGATDEAARWFGAVSDGLPSGRHRELQAQLAVGLAAVAHQRGETEAGITLYRAVFSTCREADDRSSWSRAYVGIGGIYWHSGRRQEAEDAWRSARRIARKASKARERLTERSVILCQGDRQAVPS